MIFDGRAFAREIEIRVKTRVAESGLRPKIVSILVGSDPASELYTRLKKQAAERVGIQFDIVKLDERSQMLDVREKIKIMGRKNEVTGVMVQLPIVGMSREGQAEVVKAIPLDMDVDGLRWEESHVMPATVKAILSILEGIANNQAPIINHQTNDNIQTLNIKTGQDFWAQKFVVVGGTGSVGRPLVHYLREKYGVQSEVANSKTMDLGKVARSAQVLISCAGREGLIQEDMIREGAIVIDVGMSANQRISELANQTKVVGDMAQEVYQKAAVAVPVPGGVGPVTVASLMESAVDMIQSGS